MATDRSSERPHDPQTGRRNFVSVSAVLAMGGSLAAGYGTFAAIAGRFLYPAESDDAQWQFVATIDRLPADEAIEYTAPSGAKVVVARQGEGDTADDFIALSNVCPHLGCQVHWEPQNDRFFCPCHNGAFDAQGRATEGPPAQAGQVLVRFPLRIENGLLYLQAPMIRLTPDAPALAERSAPNPPGGAQA